MVLSAVLALVPFRLSNRWKTRSLYLPIIGTLFYLVYETRMPAEMDIRIDMAFIMPILLFLWLNGIARVGLLIVILRKTRGGAAPSHTIHQRIVQMAFTLPIALGSLLWFAKMWWRP